MPPKKTTITQIGEVYSYHEPSATQRLQDCAQSR